LDSIDFIPSSAPFQKDVYLNVLNGGFALNDSTAWFFNEGFNTMFILKNQEIYSYQIYANGKRSWLKGFYIDTLNNGRLAFSFQHDIFGMLDSIIGNRIYITSLSNKYGLEYGDSWAFDQDNNDRIWLARFTAGIAVYDLKKNTIISFQYDLDNKKSFGTISLYIDDIDQLWMGTTNGLYILPDISNFDINKDNFFDKAKHINLPNNDNSLVSSIKDIGKYIAIGNRTGISFLKKSNYTDIISSPIHQLIYNEDINGIDTELNSMYFEDNRYLWLSTKNGVLKIDTWNIKIDTSPVKIVFKKIINADKPLTIDNNKIQINSVKRNISFSFKPETNPSFLNNIYYSYLLTNKNNDTIAYQKLNKNNTFRIDYLSPDKYIFKVNAFKNGILMDSKMIGISVPYTFWENPWMWVIFISVFLLLLSGFLYYRKEKIKQIAIKEHRLSKTEKEKDQLKIQTIINAFNPHFINNSLHWVQSRYYKDPQMAKLIGRLSDNINYIFKKTKEGNAIHSLKEELNLVYNYITIQKIRFSNSFEYFQPEAETIEKYSEIKLIVMQIQIHVENAIEHGIRNSANSSFVEVKINEDNGLFIITITDDGIGRIKANQIESRGSQTGLKMLREIHELFNNNPNNIKKITTIYEDEIFTNNNIKYGTRVIINIPKDYIYSL
jgi:sensor histidine kinase YesM